jgi:hypothetical protein
MNKLADDDKKDASVLWVPDKAIDPVGLQTLAGEVDSDPAFDDEQQSSNHKCRADSHFDECPIAAIAKERGPEVAAPMRNASITLMPVLESNAPVGSSHKSTRSLWGSDGIAMLFGLAAATVFYVRPPGTGAAGVTRFTRVLKYY